MKAKHPQVRLGEVISVTTGVTFLYLMSILCGLPVAWIFSLLLLSMAATVWMVIRILKDPYSTDKTFDDYFYQDREDVRRNGKE